MSDKNRTNESSNNASGSTERVESRESNRTDDYGYDFYPERHGRRDKTTLQKIVEGRSGGRTFKCISNVYWCYEKCTLFILNREQM